MCIFLKLDIQQGLDINWWKPLKANVPAKIPPTAYEQIMNTRNIEMTRAANSQRILEQERPSGSIQRGMSTDIVWSRPIPLSLYEAPPPVIPMSFSERPPTPTFGTRAFLAPVMPRQHRPYRARLTRAIRRPFWRVRHLPPPQ